MKRYTNNQIEALGKFFSCQRDWSKDFIVSSYTYEDIYRLAAGISEIALGETICLVTEDKGIIAATILASFVSNITIILPYSLSRNVLEEVRKETKFTRVIGNYNDLFSDMQIIIPKPVSTISPFLDSLKEAFCPDRIFLKLFTGGSTGKSKLWDKTYRNLFSESLFLSEKFRITEKDIFLSTVPPYHIYGLLFSVLVPMVSFAAVLPDVYMFPQQIQSMIQKFSPTVLVSIPIHYKALHRSTIDRSTSLQLAFSSAAPLNKTDSVNFFNKTGIGIIEIFGSTETGGIGSRCQATGQEYFYPFESIRWKIKEERLCIQSDYLSPSIEKDEEGFYVTGDRVSGDAHHRGFFIKGRVDDIVKIGGKRVDLKDIQNKLLQMEGIRNAIVSVLHMDTSRGNEIVAIIESDMNESEIRKYCMEVLEPYAVPRRFKIVNHIPVSSTGKHVHEWIENQL